jgi:hypothetical protein
LIHRSTTIGGTDGRRNQGDRLTLEELMESTLAMTHALAKLLIAKASSRMRSSKPS